MPKAMAVTVMPRLVKWMQRGFLRRKIKRLLSTKHSDVLLPNLDVTAGSGRVILLRIV